uniref:Uncharacterized protein n=1 Tax=Arion vulgaris TaxID=1028688 RepID=A0A0B6ZXM6_9EUPU
MLEGDLQVVWIKPEIITEHIVLQIVDRLLEGLMLIAELDIRKKRTQHGILIILLPVSNQVLTHSIRIKRDL